jgi:hypothetical protein
MKSKGFGPFRREWYSICSAHRNDDPGCKMCQTGRWVNVWRLWCSQVIYRMHKPTWIWWANRPNSKTRKWLLSVFPNLR